MIEVPEVCSTGPLTDIVKVRQSGQGKTLSLGNKRCIWLNTPVTLIIHVQYVFGFVLLFCHQFVSCLSWGSTILGQITGRHADQKIDLPCVDLRAIQQAQLVQLVSVQLQNRRVLRHCLVG